MPDQAPPRRPAASSRLMLISVLSRSGVGLAKQASVSFMMKTPRLATFWRTPVGSGFSALVADVRKIVQSLRL